MEQRVQRLREKIGGAHILIAQPVTIVHTFDASLIAAAAAAMILICGCRKNEQIFNASAVHFRNFLTRTY